MMKLSEDVVEKLKQMKANGASILDICKAFDRSESTVNRWLKSIGLTQPADRTDVTDEDVKCAWEEGLTANEIAKRFHCSHDTVTKRLDRLGIQYDRKSGILRHFSRTHNDMWSQIKAQLDKGISPSAVAVQFHMRYENVFRLAAEHNYWIHADADISTLMGIIIECSSKSHVSAKTKMKYVQGIIDYHSANGVFPTKLELANHMNAKLSAVCNALKRYDLNTFVVSGSPHDSGYAMKLRNALDDMDIHYRPNDRKVLLQESGSCMELDFFLPGVGIGIEVNSTATHSVDFPSYGISDKMYHQKKSLLAEKHGIGLVHLYDYDFLDNRVYSIFLEQLQYRVKGKSCFGARMCAVKDISASMSNEFLNRYHFQGGESSAYWRKGLYYKNGLVAVLTVGRSRYTSHDYEIIRYCTHPAYAVSGGFGRLFASILKHIGQPATIVSYMDMNKRFSARNVYESYGFKLERITSPDYVWVKKYGTDMLSRYMTTKSKLAAQGYDTDTTEVEIMRSRGYFRIYGAGSKRYVYYHIVR